ncbi:MAG: hypothetical protein KGL39_11310 [Patescibacteria group bacterium]|nr:hypothetical protein [Patescibacteria group bacterium]
MSEIKAISDIETLKRLRSEVHQAQSTDFDLAFKRAMVEDLKAYPYNRRAACEELSTLVGRDISVSMLEAFMAETKTHRMPASMLPAWVRVTRSRRVLDLVCAAAGMWLADETEHDFAEFGRVAIERERLCRSAEVLKEKLWDKA